MADFYANYIALRDVLVNNAQDMQIAKDTVGEVTLNIAPKDILAAKDPIWFGTVRMATNHVSYYLMPLSQAANFARVPDYLKRYMQGRTCFNLVHLDPQTLTDLEILTRHCAEASKGLAKSA